MIYFEWDGEKAARNLRIHGIDFATPPSSSTILFGLQTLIQ